jgi:hypothetical protein
VPLAAAAKGTAATLVRTKRSLLSVELEQKAKQKEKQKEKQKQKEEKPVSSLPVWVTQLGPCLCGSWLGLSCRLGSVMMPGTRISVLLFFRILSN